MRCWLVPLFLNVPVVLIWTRPFLTNLPFCFFAMAQDLRRLVLSITLRPKILELRFDPGNTNFLPTDNEKKET